MEGRPCLSTRLLLASTQDDCWPSIPRCSRSGQCRRARTRRGSDLYRPGIRLGTLSRWVEPSACGRPWGGGCNHRRARAGAGADRGRAALVPPQLCPRLGWHPDIRKSTIAQRFCALGAIMRAAHELQVPAEDARTALEWQTAHPIQDWNDNPARRHAEVIAKFEAAIAAVGSSAA